MTWPHDPDCRECSERPNPWGLTHEYTLWAARVCNCGETRGRHIYGHPHALKYCSGFVLRSEIAVEDVVAGLQGIVASLGTKEPLTAYVPDATIGDCYE